ncbi:hypothetical protein JG687_00005791, partial [Phytophthora cactorum]
GRATKHEAKTKFGVPNNDFFSIPCEIKGSCKLFDWGTLEKHMTKHCGSKMKWVRHIAKRDITKKKALATYIQNGTRSVFLCTLAPGFAAYEMAIRFKETDEELLKQFNRRFVALREKLQERGLQLRADSAPCKVFIKGCEPKPMNGPQAKATV